MLDDVGFAFARKCIEIMEVRGLEEEGLYRIGGVNTKITKLMMLGMDRHKTDKERLQFFHEEQHSDLLETKTIASALKHYLRNLNEPLMTYRYHNGFIAAASEYSFRWFGSDFSRCLVIFHDFSRFFMIFRDFFSIPLCKFNANCCCCFHRARNENTADK